MELGSERYVSHQLGIREGAFFWMFPTAQQAAGAGSRIGHSTDVVPKRRPYAMVSSYPRMTNPQPKLGVVLNSEVSAAMRARMGVEWMPHLHPERVASTVIPSWDNSL